MNKAHCQTTINVTVFVKKHNIECTDDFALSQGDYYNTWLRHLDETRCASCSDLHEKLYYGRVNDSVGKRRREKRGQISNVVIHNQGHDELTKYLITLENKQIDLAD